MRKKPKSITVTTLDNQSITFNFKHLESIERNFVTVEASYINWIKTGELAAKTYELTPESLKELIAVIEEYDMDFSLISAKSFLKDFPSLEDYHKWQEELSKLPKDDIKVIKN